MLVAQTQNSSAKKVLGAVRKGFSIIELLIVIAIIGALMTATFIMINRVRDAGKTSTTQTRLSNVQLAIIQFEADAGELPQSIDDLASQKGRGPYLKKEELKDGWGNKFVYRLTPEGESAYELYSYGSSAGKKTPKNKWMRVQ